MIYKIKFIIGFFLLFSTCLPLGSCQKKQILPLTAPETKAQENKVVPPESNPSDSETVGKNYLIPVTEIDINEPGSWLLFIAFIWQLPFLITVRKRRTSRLKQKVYSVFELCLSLLSIFIIYSFVFNLFYTPMLFGYMAVLLIIAYSLLTLFEIVKLKETK